MAAGRRTLAIRCDATRDIGLGHLLRCVALAEGLQEQGLRVVLVGDVTSVPLAARHVARLALPVHAAPGSPEQLVRLLDEIAADALVTDSYVLSPRLHETVSRSGRSVVAIVDAPAPSLCADLLVNQNVDAPVTMREEHRGQVLAGPEYALLRQTVTARRPRRAPVAGAVDRVLVVLGGTDPNGAAPYVTERLLHTGLPLAVDVICADAVLAAQIADLTCGVGQQVRVHAPVQDLTALAERAQLVVTAAGTTVLELACLGLPMAVVVVADNQVAGAQALATAGAGVLVGDLETALADPLRVSRVLAELLRDSDRRNAVGATAYGLVDGLGRTRVSDRIRALLPG